MIHNGIKRVRTVTRPIYRPLSMKFVWCEKCGHSKYDHLFTIPQVHIPKCKKCDCACYKGE